jgi:hypothetical protein
VVCKLVWQLKGSSAWELQVKGYSQRGQEPLDMEAEDTTPLEASTKQHTEDWDWEHQSVCYIDL